MPTLERKKDSGPTAAKLAQRIRARAERWFGFAELGSQVRRLWPWFLLCGLVGVIAGLGAVGFYYLLEAAKHYLLDAVAGYRPGSPTGEPPLFGSTSTPPSRILLSLLPALGGLASGGLVFWLAPEAEGHGTDAAILAYHHEGGAIRARVPLVKSICSAITIGSGGSAGREGPIAQIGAGLASVLGKALGLPDSQRRVMMAAGMGAGIGAIFRAPLAGALFAAEVMYGEIELEHEVLVPALFSSIVAYSTFGMFLGWQPLFSTPTLSFENPAQLIPYTILALVVAACARIYVTVFYSVHRQAKQLRAPRWLRPALGGLVVGAIGLLVPEAMATGFGVLQDAVLGKGVAGVLFAIALAKIVTTAFTVATGGSGGVFGPAVVIGGCLGGGMGLVFQDLIPHLAPPAGACALVGMAGFFAAAASTPISTVIMVSEMSGNYALLVPTMWVSLLAFLLVRGHSIYRSQLPTRIDSPAHQQDLLRSTLRRLRVADILRRRPAQAPPPIAHHARLPDILTVFSTTRHGCLPVVDERDTLVGVVSLEAVRQLLGVEYAAHSVIASDMMSPPLVIRADESVEAALRQMQERSTTSILVAAAVGGSVVDVLERNEIATLLDQGVESAAFGDVGPTLVHAFRVWIGQQGEAKKR